MRGLLLISKIFRIIYLIAWCPKVGKYFLKNILELEKMPRKDLEEAMEHLMGERMKYDNTYGLEKAIIEEIDFKTQRIQVPITNVSRHGK